MWKGKNKALTFSFDDGVTQDIKLIGILDKYGLKATFNVNSSLFGLKGKVYPFGKEAEHNKIRPDKVAEVYKDHELAAHTLTHPTLTGVDDQTIAYQVEEDRLAIERITGRPCVGMAYPGGGVNNDDRVAKVIREKTGVKFARTITPTYSFDLQENLYRFNPTLDYMDGRLFETAERFLKLKADKPQLFYVWGHSYELDVGPLGWDGFEEFCKLVSGKDDIFYGVNSEILLDK